MVKPEICRYLRVYWRRGERENLNVLPSEICWAAARAEVGRTKERTTMTQQKSEDSIKPQADRKVRETDGVESRGGGEAVPVKKQSKQLELHLETAEEFVKTNADDEAERHRSRSATCAELKSRGKNENATTATMQAVIARLGAAFIKVAKNDGAAGPDRQSIAEVREHLSEVITKLKEALQKGNYLPGEIRRVWIPKAGGAQRGLGIPNVIDRMVQEAVRQVLEPLYEPTFHSSSHGFRPERSTHTAIRQAQEYVGEGYGWVVDIDLEKFFDRVHHQRLMSKLAQRVQDKCAWHVQQTGGKRKRSESNPGALMQGTRHRRDKGVELEHQRIAEA